MQHKECADSVSLDVTVHEPEGQRVLDLSLPVQQLCHAFPELPPLLAELGFTEIVKPLMLSTVGKVMTILRGATLRGLDLDEIKTTLIAHGYTIKGE